MQPQPKASKKLTTLFAVFTRRKPKQEAKLGSKKAQGTWASNKDFWLLIKDLKQGVS
jgi:hypothetical protein